MSGAYIIHAIATYRRIGADMAMNFAEDTDEPGLRRSMGTRNQGGGSRIDHLDGLQFLTQLAKEVSSGTVDLPAFPDVVLRIRNTLSDERATADQVVRVVGAEPRFAARLIQTANSVAFNASGKPVTELRSAIARLGHQNVQSAAMSFAMNQLQNEPSLRAIQKPMRELWNRSITVAAISQTVARKTKVNPDEAFLTGLLHGIGRLYIMARATKDDVASINTEDYRELIAGWHASIGKAVLENWKFADEICEAVNDQDSYDRKAKRDADLTDVLICSTVLADFLEQPEPRTITLEGVYPFITAGITAIDCGALLQHAQYQLGALHETLGC
jgi:HD-like signal output (HDOD) protein